MALPRRQFLLFGATTAGALVIGYGLARRPDRIGSGGSLPLTGAEVALNGYVTVDARGHVGVAVPRAEMGQGVRTALAMLVAEEMDADFAQVTARAAPVDAVYANIALLTEDVPDGSVAYAAIERVGRFMGLQVTGGSTSVRDAWLPMRRAGAMARAMLVSAAAERWNLRPDQVVVHNGRLQFAPDQLDLGFGAFATRAAQLSPPTGVRLKSRTRWRLIGTSPRRLDGQDKVRGAATFGIDVRPANLLFAAVRFIDPIAGEMLSHDAGDVAQQRGVSAVVPLPNGVAVVADNTWRAEQAAGAVTVRASRAPGLIADSAALSARLRAALDASTPFVHEAHGALPTAHASRHEAIYEAPLLAHACMEPINCTARVSGRDCELWIPTQAPAMARALVAAMLRTSRERVTVHQTLLGGGFGRRADLEMVRIAVQVAQAVEGRPVQVVWSRESDIRHGVYRPAAMARLVATLDADGWPLSLQARTACDSVVAGISSRLIPGDGARQPDQTSVDGLVRQPYRIPHVRVEEAPAASGVPVGFWRSVGFSQNAFFSESFHNELAARAGVDPLDWRRRLLANRPRHLAVLERLARVSKWAARTSASGSGWGIALVESFGAVVGQVVEVHMPRPDRLSVRRVTCVADCGTVLHPDLVRAQMESGIIFALSAALFGRIDLVDGAIVQSNFHDYPVVRMAQCPEIRVSLLASKDAPGGAGEPGTPPLAPALTEAVFDASGRRLRALPLAAADIAVV